VSGSRMSAEAKRAVAEAPDAVVAAGGDGTVSCVANAAADSPVPLGVLPTGTLNHFARDLGVPLPLEDAARVIAARNVRRVDIAEVNGRRFINNSSIGIYAHIIRKREELRQRLGRGKWVALFLACLAVFRRYPTVRVRIDVGDKSAVDTTPFVFVGNNRYEINLTQLGRRPRLDGGELSVYFSHRTGRFGLLRLAVRALLGKLEQAKDFESLSVQEVWIETRRRELRVALDGEVVRMTPPLHYRIHPGALNVLAPPAVREEERGDAKRTE
jgi:diacylglycerol kinase family enzyme